LLREVVAGIVGYGNCIGIPTVGGEIMFDETYSANPLVNVFCLGILKHSDIAKGAASGIGNAIYYVGAATGRDGIHGATFACVDGVPVAGGNPNITLVARSLLKPWQFLACDFT